MWRSCAGMLLVVCCWVPEVPAQVDLLPKFTPGSAVTREESQEMTAKVMIADQNVDLSAGDRFSLRQEILAPQDGKTAIKRTLMSASLVANAMGQESQFDSANPNSPKSANEDFEKEATAARALLNSPLTYFLDENGRTARVEGVADLIRKAPGNDVKVLEERFPEQRLKDELDQQLQVLPGMQVKAGDTWQRVEVLYLSGGSTLSFDRTYEYVGPMTKNGRALEHVKVSTTAVRLTLGPNDVGLTLKEAKLEIKASDGEYWFDREVGAVIEYRAMARIVGPATLQAGGNDLSLQLDLTLTTNRTSQP